MAYDLEEQEQLDELRDFWKKYGNFILTVITVVLLAFAGWRAWGWWEVRQSGEAAQAYERLRTAAEAKDIARVKEHAGVIFSEFARTTYAPMAALVAARAYFDADDLKAAKAPLQWVIDNASGAEFRHAARLRLAAILLDEKDYEAGLKLLEGPPTGAFSGLYADRRGDILAAQGKAKLARAAYGEALEKLGTENSQRRIVQLKIDALEGGGS